MEVVDELVVMRLAQMIDERLVDAAFTRALVLHRGNGSCLALAAYERPKKPSRQGHAGRAYAVGHPGAWA
jgi:hypothetical protein